MSAQSQQLREVAERLRAIARGEFGGLPMKLQASLDAELVDDAAASFEKLWAGLDAMQSELKASIAESKAARGLADP
ncbi:MAG TPA: hypothetical protein VK634_17165 [Reyranella sp.]|nr:hypothetical protein [Reyranella sp.]HTE82418.1 hypothetical protein [Reyranella sp.]